MMLPVTALALVALVLASVVHLLLLMVLAAVGSAFLFWPFRSRHARLAIVFILGGLPILTFGLLKENVLLVKSYVENVVVRPLRGQARASTDWERALYARPIAVRRVLEELPRAYATAPWIGVGPGQVTSRASLIGTGVYLGGMREPRRVPLITPVVSPAAALVMIDLWTAGQRTGYSFGSSYMPFFSWLSLYAEFGLIGVMIVVGVVTWSMWRVRRCPRLGNRQLKAFAFGTGVLLLVFLGVQENYWEVPQAILVGCLTLKVLYGNLIWSPDRDGLR